MLKTKEELEGKYVKNILNPKRFPIESPKAFLSHSPSPLPSAAAVPHPPRVMASKVAVSAAGVICKRIVRKVGHDSLPVEALDALKKTNAEKIVMEKAERRILPTRNLQFTNKALRGEAKTKKTWRPNIQLKRLFNYIHDREIEPKVTVHSLRCIDRTGLSENIQLKTPYHKPEHAQPGLLWRGRVERGYVELWKKAPGYFSPEEEARIERALRQLNPKKKGDGVEFNSPRRGLREAK